MITKWLGLSFKLICLILKTLSFLLGTLCLDTLGCWNVFKHMVQARNLGSLNKQMNIDHAFLVKTILPIQDLLAILRAIVVCWPKGGRRI